MLVPYSSQTVVLNNFLLNYTDLVRISVIYQKNPHFNTNFIMCNQQSQQVQTHISEIMSVSSHLIMYLAGTITI